MVTDVSEPVWRCDRCGTRHGADRDLAVLCESAPVPDPLPDGTPLLAVRGEHFSLAGLHPTDRVVTDTTPYNRAAGHHRQYTVENTGYTTDDGAFRPARAGRVQVPTPVRDDETALRLHGDSPEHGHVDTAAVRALAGLAVHRYIDRASWDSRGVTTAPLAPAMLAVMGLLDAAYERDSGYRQSSRRVSAALCRAGGSVHLANRILAAEDPDQADRRNDQLITRWLQGQPVTLPFAPPYLDVARRLTRSKLTRPQRAVIAAAGVDWPPRAEAIDYLNRMIGTLMDTRAVRTDTRMFPGRRVIAVGGGKGGVGKSTVAAALAARLAADRPGVLLLDMDLDGPTQHVLFRLPDSLQATPDGTGILACQAGNGLRVLSTGQLPAGVLPYRWGPAAAADWLRFVAETVSLDDVHTVVIDLPAGFGPAVTAVLSARIVDVLVAVGNPDPAGAAPLEASLHREFHEEHQVVVVENLGRVTGTDAAGHTVEIRPHGPDTPLRDLAGRHHADYAGSLPYTHGWEDLAGTPEVGVLAGAVTAGKPAGR